MKSIDRNNGNIANNENSGMVGVGVSAVVDVAIGVGVAVVEAVTVNGSVAVSPDVWPIAEIVYWVVATLGTVTLMLPEPVELAVIEPMDSICW
jgi:hypothetical protein